MGQDDGRSLSGRATPAEPVVSALREGIANAGNDPTGYPEQSYVEGVRDLADMIERDKTANWLAMANVLRDCAALIQHYAQGMETGTAKTEGLGPKDDSPVGTMRQDNPTQGIQP